MTEPSAFWEAVTIVVAEVGAAAICQVGEIDENGMIMVKIPHKAAHTILRESFVGVMEGKVDGTSS